MNELMHNFKKIAHALHHSAASDPFENLTDAQREQLAFLLEKAAKDLPERHGHHGHRDHHAHGHQGYVQDGTPFERPVDDQGYCIACGKHCPPDNYRCDGKK